MFYVEKLNSESEAYMMYYHCTVCNDLNGAGFRKLHLDMCLKSIYPVECSHQIQHLAATLDSGT